MDTPIEEKERYECLKQAGIIKWNSPMHQKQYEDSLQERVNG